MFRIYHKYQFYHLLCFVVVAASRCVAFFQPLEQACPDVCKHRNGGFETEALDSSLALAGNTDGFDCLGLSMRTEDSFSGDVNQNGATSTSPGRHRHAS